MRVFNFYTLICVVALAMGPIKRVSAASTDEAGPCRVDFDDRVIKGQRPHVSGVYIFARPRVAFKDMLQKPRSFRQRILTTVFGE